MNQHAVSGRSGTLGATPADEGGPTSRSFPKYREPFAKQAVLRIRNCDVRYGPIENCDSAVFGDQAMTLAAIDRLVHHATILEMNVESYRRKAALKRKRGPAD